MLHTSPRREERRVDQEGKDAQQQQSGGLWAAGIFFVALVFLFIVLGGYAQKWEWTGLAVDPNYPRRTLWDWLDLLIVPVVLALGGYLFTRSENHRTQQIAEQRAEIDRGIADQRRQDEMLQAYLDNMSEMLADPDRPLHRAQIGDRLSVVARARSLPVIRRLDTGRKRIVVQFLYEAGLISRDHRVIDLDRIDLTGAGLNELYLNYAYLRGAFLIEAYLNGAFLEGASLSGAFLEGAELRGATLINADLRETDLSGTDLRGADLSGADLSQAILHEANLSAAVLHEASLRDAYLAGAILHPAALDPPSDPNSVNAFLYRKYFRDTDLRDADLSGADLSGTLVTREQLAPCKSLQGATMPSGQKYEYWLKETIDERAVGEERDFE
jgi:uncharacterized protein YjbI with pentapeptide repeats